MYSAIQFTWEFKQDLSIVLSAEVLFRLSEHRRVSGTFSQERMLSYQHVGITQRAPVAAASKTIMTTHSPTAVSEQLCSKGMEHKRQTICHCSSTGWLYQEITENK